MAEKSAKKEEQQLEKAAKARNNIVHQRIEERISFAQKPKPKFDIDKCPLLSKPGELYKRKMRMGSSTSNLNYPIFQVRSSSSQSNTNNSENSNTKNSASGTISEEPSDELKTSHENVNTLAKGDKTELTPSNQSEEGQDEQQSSCLRNIYPSTRFKSNYSHLFITEHIADIFIYFTLSSGVKYMGHSDFRHFVK